MLSSPEIKRQILESSDTSGYREKWLKGLKQATPGGPTEGELIQQGKELEALTRMPGWTWIDKFLMSHLDLGAAFGTDAPLSDFKRGMGRGFMMLMHYVDQAIKTKNAILKKEEIDHAKRQGKTQEDINTDAV